VKRRVTLLTAAVLAVAETYRRGYMAPLAFGCRQWAAALNPRTTTEPDYMA
jgi:hypothetical protein